MLAIRCVQHEVQVINSTLVHFVTCFAMQRNSDRTEVIRMGHGRVHSAAAPQSKQGLIEPSCRDDTPQKASLATQSGDLFLCFKSS